MRTFSCTRVRWLGAWVSVLFTAGCAAHLSEHVPSAAVAELPLECRLALLDAESEVLAAQDARDAQEETALAATEAVREAAHRVRVSEEALDGKENDDVARAAHMESSARREFAEADDSLQHVRLATADAALLLAQARFELARAREVDRVGQGGRYSVRLTD
jgi:hypothetical protein